MAIKQEKDGLWSVRVTKRRPDGSGKMWSKKASRLSSYEKAQATESRFKALLEAKASLTLTPTATKQIKGMWSVSQVQEFVAVASKATDKVGKAWWPIWELALATGLRSGELFALTWKDVEILPNGVCVLKIRTAYSRTNKQYKCPKNGTSRVVPLPKQLSERFSSYLKMFPNASGSVVERPAGWETGAQSRILKNWLKEHCPALPLVRFHDLRAVYATQLLLTGAPLHVVQKICGWNQLATAERYLRASSKDVVEHPVILPYHP